MIKKIAIMVAMDKELVTIKSYLENIKTSKTQNMQVFLGTLADKEIILCKTGIGKVAAATYLTKVIEKYHPDLVINMGIAGGFDQKLQTLDVVIANSTVYADVDMTSDSFTDLIYGQLEGLPPYFIMDKGLIEDVKMFFQDENFHYGMIASGDQFVTSYEKTKNLVDTYFKDYHILAFDMESAAISHVCYLYHLPCLIIRTISDIIGSSTDLDYQCFSVKASDKVGLITKSLIENL